MQMNEGLDTGDMLHKVYCEIAPEETSLSLYHKLENLAPPALIEVLDGLEAGNFRLSHKRRASQIMRINYPSKKPN